MRRPLVHALYTNAPGAGGSGFRFLHLPEGSVGSWPAADRRRLEDWLSALEPSAAETTGREAAATAMRLGGELRAIFARAVPGFERDAHGRGGGRLVHALLVPVEEGSDRCLHHAALVAASEELVAPSAPESLDAHLDRARRATELDCPPVPAGAAGGLRELLANERPSIAAFLAVGSGGHGADELRLPVAPEELVPLLAGAVGALPPRLRLAVRWAAGFESRSAEVLVVRADENAIAPSAPAEMVAYLDRLAGLLEAGRGETAAGWLDDWEIRSWRELLERVEEAQAERNSEHGF